MKQKCIALLTALIVFLMSFPILAQTKQLLNYQGRLTLKDNKPVASLVKMDFSIWSSAEGGDKLWEELDRAIQIQNGIFNVALGSVVSFPEYIFLPAADRYLEIKVNGEKLEPRFLLTSAPYVVQPAIPRGGIIMWSGAIDQIPPGWALCDGKEYPRTDGRGSLKTPDLQDKFIVGAGRLYPLNKTGGEPTVKLEIKHLPKHNHSSSPHYHHYYADDMISQKATIDDRWNYDASSDSKANYGVKARTTSNTVVIGSTGEDTPHENMPPFLALAYIMKL